MIDQDRHIIERVLEGDRRAYAELVDRHKNKAMILALRMLKNQQEAEEALQDAFVRAFRALPGFQSKSSFATWLYRIVFNVCSTALNKRGKEFFVSIDEKEDDGLDSEIPSGDDEPDIQAEGKELNEIVSSEIEQMEGEYSSILTLFYLQEMSYEEIVSVTGFPLGTVKNRLFRARTLLRKAVARRYQEMHIEAA